MSNEELAIRIQQGDRKAAAQLWEQIYPLIYTLLRRFYPLCKRCGIEPDDLRQSGYSALLRTVEAYDPARGLMFSSYLAYHVGNVAKETLGFRGSGRTQLPRVSLSLSEPVGGDEGDSTLADILRDPDANTPFERVEDGAYHAELHDTLEECLARLPDDHADALRERYYEDRTPAVMAKLHGTTAHQEQQRVQKGMQGMRTGENWRRLRECRGDITARSRLMGGLNTFRHTGYSSVEWAVDRLMGGRDGSREQCIGTSGGL